MGRRIVGGSDAIVAATNDLISLHDHRTERPAGAPAHHPERKPNRLAHELLVHAKSCRISAVRGSCFPPSKNRSSPPPRQRRKRCTSAKVKSGAAAPCPPTSSPPRRTLSSM